MRAPFLTGLALGAALAWLLAGGMGKLLGKAVGFFPVSGIVLFLS